jgi:hypothetical protein
LLCRMYGWELITEDTDIVPDATYDRDTGMLFWHNL